MNLFWVLDSNTFLHLTNFARCKLHPSAYSLYAPGKINLNPERFPFLDFSLYNVTITAQRAM